jgi:hypothetical protein
MLYAKDVDGSGQASTTFYVNHLLLYTRNLAVAFIVLSRWMFSFKSWKLLM